MVDVLASVVQVPIGGLVGCRPPQLLTTLLGSCVGMVVQDLRHHVMVLAHVVRPSGHGAGMGPGYYADRAAPAARDLAIQLGADPRQLVVRMAGGGSMAGVRSDVGKHNAAAIREATYALGMVFGGHVAGPADGGCVLVADPARGKLLVRRLMTDVLDERGFGALVEEMVRT